MASNLHHGWKPFFHFPVGRCSSRYCHANHSTSKKKNQPETSISSLLIHIILSSLSSPLFSLLFSFPILISSPHSHFSFPILISSPLSGGSIGEDRRCRFFVVSKFPSWLYPNPNTSHIPTPNLAISRHKYLSPLNALFFSDLLQVMFEASFSTPFQKRGMVRGER